MGKNKKAQIEQKPPYSNMAARKIVLIVGASLTAAAFVIALYATLAFFIPGMIAQSATLPGVIVKALYITALAGSFIGLVLSVAGANTKKSIARLSFFLGTVTFIVSAAFLVILLFFLNIIPFQAFGRLLA